MTRRVSRFLYDSQMTLDELAAATKELQDLQDAILQAFQHERPDDYPALRKRMNEARTRYDELADRSFQD